MNRLAALALLLLAACNTSEPEPAIVMDLGPRANLLQACEKLDDMVACANLARDYQRGTNGDVNLDAAKRLYRKACEGPVLGACNSLGILLEEQDPAQALVLYERACSAPELDIAAPGCNNAGNFIATKAAETRPLVDALNAWRKGCRGGSQNSCFNVYAALERIPKAAADDDEAANALKRACELGDKDACTMMATP